MQRPGTREKPRPINHGANNAAIFKQALSTTNWKVERGQIEIVHGDYRLIVAPLK